MSAHARVDNFNAGPSALPLEVLEAAQRELLNFRGTGMSVMELSHRSEPYERVHMETEACLRRLLGIGEDYDVLFLQGGASLQFAMVPMNFLQQDERAGYVVTGVWSEKAMDEAKRFGEAVAVASTKDEGYRRIPAETEYALEGGLKYLHLTSNNTVIGSQFHAFPEVEGSPLIADMSSDILSRTIDVNRFHLIYAGAQKNLGPSGVTVVVVKKSWLEEARKDIPTMLRYDIHAKNRSLYNTPPTFGIYLMGLFLAWIEQQGGLAKIEAQNRNKAARVYHAIDESDGFYHGYVEPASRSSMNITFRLRTPELEKVFLQEAEDSGLVGLKGHRLVGGCRASVYNAVSMDACERLGAFMEEFHRRHR